ncbi:DUF2812 domain-containing protein [Trichococcus shcherbakoviae]|uniref:DUF2812 domain-containing protein n=1 Tax=Trichococcus shcherbakoviae TaxID=2094020 RepID=UPI002AA6FB17|nr:DUF2812 domain-containing protein [Trichococcus shcherbakoviae]
MMKKFRFYYDKDKDEAFLNDMSAKGYAMKRFFLGVYTFEKCQPGEYTYRVDLISDKTTEQRNELYDLIRDSGGELVQTWGIWAIFRKKGNFELYTDPESQIKQFERIRKIFVRVAIVEFLLSMPQWYNAIQTKEPMLILMAMLLTVIAFVFLKQVGTCTKKITELEKLS